MWAPFTDAARDALAGSHTAVVRVDILHSGRPVYTLDVIDGQVTVDAARAVRRNLSCTLVDPTGSLSTGDIDDLLNPYVCEIAPWRGVRAGGVEELAPLGVFGLTGRKVSDSPDGLVIDIAGQDRAMSYQGKMATALTIHGGTPAENAIAQLLGRRNPGVAMDAMVTGYTVGPLIYAPDIDVWAEAQKIAVSVGASLFHDRTGRCVLVPAGPASASPVASWAEGDGLLLTVDRSEDSDTVSNVVVAESTNGAIRAVAEDLDPTSPTYSGGVYGRRVAAPLVSQHIRSVLQAQQAAAARLAYELGRSETVNFTAVPDPGLDVQEVVTVHRPRAGLTHRAVTVATLTMPLSVDESMKVGCRRSIRTQDGAVLPVTEL